MVLKIERILVTPELACEWLEKFNTDNYRKIVPNVIRRYMHDMKHGRWTENSATIAFATDGSLVDGQHRLTAIAKSGMSIWLNVLTGLAPEARGDHNQDRGKPRDIAAFMTNTGVKNASSVAATIRLLYRLAKGNTADRSGSTSLTDSAMLSVVSQMSQEFFDVVDKVCGSQGKKFAAGSIICSFMWLATNDNRAAADTFLDIFCKKTPALSDHAANSLRDQLISLKNGKTAQVNGDYVLNLFLAAYKAHAAGKSLKMVKPYQEHQLTAAMKKELKKLADIVNSN